MKIGHFDCFSGAAGDMILGALIDAGCPLETLQDVISRLKLPGVALSAERVKKQGIAATQVAVEIGLDAPRKHRHLRHILDIIDGAQLDPLVTTQAKTVFERLAEAEAAVHDTTPQKIHFHEVGADDAIVDIVCACAGLHHLGITHMTCSPVVVGSGTVKCEHGVMPVPAPATARLLTGIPLAASDESGELMTPTGAAILATLCDSFGPMPAMTIRAVGYGAGTRDGATRPNVLRLILGDTGNGDSSETDCVVLLEANLDDASGQSVAHAAQLLRDAAALDVFVVPIMMKKSRPGQILSVLCRPDDVDALETILFRETPTFGIRRSERVRSLLSREHIVVSTPFGEIRVKIGRRSGQVQQAWPEYEDCAEAARRGGTSLSEVQSAALEAWKKR